MDKIEEKDIEVNKPKKVRKPKKKYLIKVNVGTNPDGSIKFPAGSLQELSRKQQINYKQNNII